MGSSRFLLTRIHIASESVNISFPGDFVTVKGVVALVQNLFGVSDVLSEVFLVLIL